MKFVIENNCQTCREISSKTLDEIYTKMCLIQDNVREIVDFLFKQYPQDYVSREYKDRKEELIINIDEVLLDTDIALDEFYIRYGEQSNDYIPIELLTEEVARANDLDFVNENNGYTKEELDTYEVGGTLSIYTKLSDNYYFRFL